MVAAELVEVVGVRQPLRQQLGQSEGLVDIQVVVAAAVVGEPARLEVTVELAEPVK